MTPTRTYMIYTTDHCNLRCSYCYVDQSTARRMTLEMADKVTDFILRDEAGEKGVTFFGGEPLLNTEVMFHLVDRLRPHYPNMPFLAITNGTLIERHADSLLAYKVKLQLSLDGSREGHNIHRLDKQGNGVFDSIPLDLYTSKFSHMVRMTITPHNLRYFTKSLRELSTRGVRTFTTCHDRSGEWSEHDLALYREEWWKAISWWMTEGYKLNVVIREPLDTLRRLQARKAPAQCGGSCQPGQRIVAITVQGKLYGCHAMAGQFRYADEWAEKMCLGDVEAGYKPTHPFSADFTRPTRNGCDGCHANPVCYGGCYHENFYRTNDFFSANPVACSIIQIHADLALRLAYTWPAQAKAMLEQKGEQPNGTV